MSLSDIDDIGLAFLIDAASAKPRLLASAEWNVTNSGGSAQRDFTNDVPYGLSFVVLALHNKRFAFGVGKWQYDMALIGDQKVIWRKADWRREAALGIQFWKVFRVYRNQDGISIAAASAADVNSFRPFVANLNRSLIRDYATENSSIALAAGAFVVGMLASSSSNAQSSNAGEESRREQEAREWGLWQSQQRDNWRRENPGASPSQNPYGCC